MTAAPKATSPRILVAGIGNIFLGDDAFGSEVAQRLIKRPQRDGVRIIDFGIRGLDLMYALADGCDVAILIDAVPRGETPGTLFLLEPEIESISADATASPMLEAHSMDPVKVLRSAAAMGNLPAQIFIVGCEPSPLPEEDMQMEISAPVQASIEEAVAMVERIVHRFAGIRSDKLNEVLTVPALALSQELP